MNKRPYLNRWRCVFENRFQSYTPHAVKPLILFEDSHLIIFTKPAGMLSQPDVKGEASLVDWLREHFGRYYVGLIHRLDRNTSGIMVAAKRTKAARRLTAALQDGTLKRTYRAFLHGHLEEECLWRHWLVKNEADNRVTVYARTCAGAQEASLHVEPLAHGQWEGRTLTLAEFHLQTGRSHQIRAQAAFSGHPLLGDAKYGSKARINSAVALEFPRPALHSWQIECPHPMSGEILRFQAPLPPDLASIKLT